MNDNRPFSIKLARRRPRRNTLRFGDREVVRIGVPGQFRGDGFHKLMRASWPVFVIVFSGYYLLLNALFGLLYYVDLAGIENARPGSYSDAFMFSVQTIATIGFGHLAPKSTYVNCLVVIESIVALLGLSLWSGLAFARFSRPSAYLMFSTVAVIANDNGVPTLMFRVANGRGNRIVDASVSVTMLRDDINAEGVEWRRQIDLKLVRARSAVFALTWTVQHRIDASSPLAEFDQLVREDREPQLVVSLIGIDDTFGQPVHAMQTYDAAHILKGKRFADISSSRPDGKAVIDFTRFNDVVDDPSNVSPGPDLTP